MKLGTFIGFSAIGCFLIVGAVTGLYFLIQLQKDTDKSLQIELDNIALPEQALMEKQVGRGDLSVGSVSEDFDPKAKVNSSHDIENNLMASTISSSNLQIKNQENVTQREIDDEIPNELIFDPDHTDARNSLANEPEVALDANIGKIEDIALPTNPLWQVNSVTNWANSLGPKIAIVIDDAGIDMRRTRHVIDLPGPLTISFLTYAKHLSAQVKQAKKAGHEILCHIPMQPNNPNLDPGPNVLSLELTDSELVKRLEWAFSRVPDIVGINNHMGSRFTSDPRAMGILMRELRRFGLLFLDSRTTAKSVGHKLAKIYHIPFAERNVFLDHNSTPASISKQLLELEAIATRKGYAVAIGHPRENTIKALSQWLPIIAEKGLTLVPISAIIRKQRSIKRG